MYLPPHFREDDVPTLHAAIRAFPFAILITPGAQGMAASHLPMLLDEAPAPYGTLRCHLARGNEQWRGAAGGEALVIFRGPDAYISPSWYPTKQRTGKVVPTWNYIAVHAYGTPRVFDDAPSLRALVARLTDLHEQRFPAPWSIADAPEDFVASQLRGIVGLEIPIARLLGKWKLGQNRTDGDAAGAIAGLERDDAPGAAAIATAMRERSV